MPARRTERASERPRPYNLRRSSNMAAAVMPHMSPWQGMNPHTTMSHTPVPTWQHSMSTFQPPSMSSSMPPYQEALIATPSLNVHQPHMSHNRRPSHSHSNSQSVDGPWTAEMDTQLMEAQARGLRWEQISQQYFPHKSANACRKRFGRAKEERRATDWDEQRIQKVIGCYNKDGFREQLWGLLARETKERWEDIEKLCYSQGIAKMVRGRGHHSRTRSRVSSGQHIDDSRYHSSNDEYDPRDDSGIGLGLQGTNYHAVSQPTVTTAAPLDQLIHPNAPYQYT